MTTRRRSPISRAPRARSRRRATRVAIFGRTPAQIDHIVASREVDRALIVKSPIAGRITARNAAPGLLVQPGNAPAPFTVSPTSPTIWMMATYPRSDSIEIKVGAPVSASILALPGPRVRRQGDRRSGRPSTRIRAASAFAPRSGIRRTSCVPACSPPSSYRPASPCSRAGVPLDGVVREGDGTMSVWVVGSDPHRVHPPLGQDRPAAGWL